MEFDSGALAQVRQAVEKFGTPLYLYFPELIASRMAFLRQNTSGFKLRYAVKTNPNPWLLKWLYGKVESLDVSSSGEIDLALSAGWEGKDLEFTGPAKTRSDLDKALDAGIRSIVVEDFSELQLLDELSAARDVVTRVLVRIAPAMAEEKFGVRLAGRPTQFGVDEDTLGAFFQQAAELSHIKIDGFHIYSGSQCLDDEAMATHFTTMWRVFSETIKAFGQPISELVFGAGMGIPYHDGDNHLSLAGLPEAIAEIQHELTELGNPLACYIELGRYLVGEAGLFITEVTRVKNSKGTDIIICDGGMNHNLGACGHLGGVSHRHYSMRVLPQAFNDNGGLDMDTQTYRVVGPLCTAIDTLALRVKLPVTSAGDLVVVGCAGAYGPSASPLFFISHKPPVEAICETISGTAQFENVSWLAGSSRVR